MPKTTSSTKPKFIELFAGVGGFRLGLEQAGWVTAWSNQWEPTTRKQHASSCYVANFGPENHSNEDISIVIAKAKKGKLEIPSAEMIVGGFPCQDYSVAKSLSASAGIEGKKGVLWWEIHKLVSSHRPKLVFLENVDRLLKSPSKQRGRDFAIMLRTLGDLGYLIEWKVVNSADYGFTQRRIRVFIVAVRKDLLGKNFKFSTDYLESSILGTAFPSTRLGPLTQFELGSDPALLSKSFNRNGDKSPFENSGSFLGSQVITATFSPETPLNSTGRLRDVLVDDSEVPKEYWIDPERIPEWEFLKGAKKLVRKSAKGHEYTYSEGKMAFPDSLDKPSRTILTGEGGTSPSRFKHVIKTKSGYRRLLPIELERLNGFPDDWTKLDSEGQQIPDTRRAFFMGNALVVGLITRVGSVLLERFPRLAKP
jgi:DNA (cytosine-5)-methyltransferase 1